MRLLVLTSEPVNADQLRDALPGDADPTDAEVMVVAPALHESALRFWLSDADDAIARADEVRRRSLDQLGAEGVPASADTGESDPEGAIEDVLETSTPTGSSCSRTAATRNATRRTWTPTRWRAGSESR
jgi:hypothetical protein